MQILSSWPKSKRSSSESLGLITSKIYLLMQNSPRSINTKSWTNTIHHLKNKWTTWPTLAAFCRSKRWTKELRLTPRLRHLSNRPKSAKLWLGIIRVKSHRLWAKTYSRVSAQINTTLRQANLAAESRYRLIRSIVIKIARICQTTSGKPFIQRGWCTLTINDYRFKPEIVKILLMQRLHTRLGMRASIQILNANFHWVGTNKLTIIRRSPNL